MVAALAFALSILLNKRIHETLPVAVFTATLGVYVLALVLQLNVAVWICLGLTGTLLAYSLIRGSCPKLRTLGNSALLPLIILLAVCVMFCALVSGHRVFFYDDLSYWGLYTKNIFSINKLPHLFENCSVDYKDYTPIMQILQYMAMFGRKTFSEGEMFQTNVCFIYIMLLPILSALDETGDETGGRFPRFNPVRIVAVIMYVIFPHILTAQFYYRLGVDLFLALVFGYILYYVFLYEASDKQGEVFRIIAIVTGLSFLALIKSSGIVLCILALIMLMVREAGRKGIVLKLLIPAIFTFGSYFTWQIFLRYSWNNGYLSNRFKAGVTSGGLSFPSYTKEVVLNYIKHFFAYPLTRNTVGVTAFVLLIFIVAVHIVVRRRPHEDSFADSRLLICSLTGLLIFCLAHLGMYLFIFDEWEAHGLMEFDRYITQYLGGIFFLYVCILVKSPANRALLTVSAIVFIALLPYADMKQYLIRSNYEAAFEESHGESLQSAQREWDASGIAGLNLAHDGTQKLEVVANAWDETTQFIEYVAVPQPIFQLVNVPAADPGTINGFIMDSVDEYVYVCENAPESYLGDWNETAEITSDGIPLKAGGVYIVDRNVDEKILRELKK